MAGTVASPLLDVVCDRLDSHARALSKNSCFRNMRRKLAELQALLQDAERPGSDPNTSLRAWLSSILRDIVYDIDMLIDDWELSKAASSSSCFPSFVYTSKFDKDLNIIHKRLDFIFDSFYKFFPDYDDDIRKVDDQSNVVESLISDDDIVLGRDFDFYDIVNTMFQNNDEDKLRFIPIVGMGGIGKTILARRIYNDERVKSHFHFRVWVTVGVYLDIATVAEAIAVEYKTLTSENVLEPSEVLGEKRFLIVLDDVWDEDRIRLEKLKAWLNVGDSGSCVLVTTRSTHVAALMGTVPERHLTCLSDEESWALFKYWAFRSMEEENAEFEKIGLNIVANCKGLPLAVKTIGGLLCSKSVQEWYSVMRDGLWKLPEFRSRVLPVLRLSYDRLPSHLKQCFVYCLIFPKGYWINKEKLVQLWIAEGFVRLTSGSEVLEDVANYYYMELLQRSFFHDVVGDGFGQLVSCRMHDFMHDLAQFVAGVECSTMSVGYPRPVCGYVQYCSSNSMQFTTPKAENLRTLLLLSGKLENTLSLLHLFNRLRVLDLSHSGLIELSASIGTLKNLRYLDLSQTYIRRIPRSISRLKQLWTLKLSSCYNLEELPNAICQLTNLRNLVIESCCSLIHMPSGIQKLRLLRNLSTFILGKRRGCANLQELRWLDLVGRLDIKNLENVKNVVDARKVKLHEKVNINSLELSWSFNATVRGDISAQVLEALRPPLNLEVLCLKGYRGFMFPLWINTGLPNLVKVSLIDCHCQELPPLGHLPNLKDLYVKRMPAVEIIGCEFYGNGTIRGFPSLQQLELHDMPKLLEWKNLAGEETDGLTSIQEPFPCLEKLVVEGCCVLNSLPFIPNLKNLALCNSNKMLLSSSLDCLPSLSSLVIDNFQAFDHLRSDYGNINSVVKLTLHECANLETLFEVAHIFPSVRHLSILHCDELSSLSFSLSRFRFLQKLDIVECRRLFRIIDLQLLCNLLEIRIEGCPWLTLSSSSIRFLICLKTLVIRRCPEVGRQLCRETNKD